MIIKVGAHVTCQTCNKTIEAGTIVEWLPETPGDALHWVYYHLECTPKKEALPPLPSGPCANCQETPGIHEREDAYGIRGLVCDACNGVSRYELRFCTTRYAITFFDSPEVVDHLHDLAKRYRGIVSSFGPIGSFLGDATIDVPVDTAPALGAALSADETVRQFSVTKR